MANISNTKPNSLVSGTAYADTIKNTANGVTIVGYAGNDSVNNSSDYVSIDGGDDNDKIYNTGSNVTIDTGSGKDSVDNNSGYVTINTGAGEDSVYNRSNNVTISTGDAKDSIRNYKANYTLIESGYGNDYIYNQMGHYVTIDGGAGNDDINNYNSSNVTISAGDDNDTIYNSNNSSLVAIDGGSGNDSIRNWGGKSLTIYGGAGNDTINNEYSANNSEIDGGAGDDSIHNENSNNLTVTGGDGDDTIYNEDVSNITVSGGKGNDLITFAGTSNYDDEDDEDNYYYDEETDEYIYIGGDSGNGRVIKYSNGDGDDTVYGFDELTTLQIGGGTDTYATLVSGNDVIIYVGDGSILLNGGAKLGQINITGEEKELPIWRYSGNNTATYGQTNNPFVTVSGVKSTTGISLSGKVITINNSALNNSNVTVNNSEYTLQLGYDVPISTTTDEGWTINNSIANYNAAAISAGYLLSNNQIYYISASGGETLITLNGVNSLDGISLNGSLVTLSSSALKNSNVTINSGYTLALGNDVTRSETTPATWTLSGTTATYKSEEISAGYTIIDNKIYYINASGGNTLITVKGVSSLDGLYLNGTTVTLANSALNQGTVTITDGYTLKFANDVPISQTTAAGWTLNGTTATYKSEEVSAGYKLVNNQITYVTASGGEVLATIKGVKSLDGLSFDKKIITLSAAALGTDDIIVTGGYKLASDVPISQTTAAGWTFDGTTATYKSAATSAGYTINDDKITYTAASGGDTLVTVSGVNSSSGLTLSGTTVTVANSALNQETVTINDGYTLKLGSNVLTSKTTPAGWTLNGTTATYKSEHISEGYKLENNTISYVDESGGDTLFTVTGVKSLKGLSFNGNIVTVAASALNKGTVSISEGYILKLDDDVATPETTEAGWNINGTSATYKTASNKAGYSLKDNQIIYTAASNSKTLATVSGVKSMKGLTIDDKVVTVSKAALGTDNISVSKGYTLVLGDDVKKSTTAAAGWTLKNTTATYKAASTTAGYKLDNNKISYVKASGGNTLVTVKGVKSTNGLSLKDKVVTVAKSSLNSGKVTISGNDYTLKLANDVTKTSTSKAWSIKSSTATYKQTTKAGYSLANNAISYTKAASKTLATVKGVKSTSGLKVSGKNITVSKASLNSKKVTVSDGYTLKLGSDVTKSKATKAWSYSNSTATYKQTATAGYALADNAINYSKKATSTLATIKGAKSKSGLSVSEDVIKLKNSALKSKVTVSGAYEFDFQSDYKKATITGSSDNDTITARGSKISVNGGKGDDTIKIFGTGTVTGGDGADIFYYKSTGANVITDYANDDKISIASGTAKVSTSGNNVILTVGKGKITVTGGIDKDISYVEDGEEKTYKGIAEYIKYNSRGTAVTLKAGYTAESFTPSEYSKYKDTLVTIEASAVTNPLTITGNKKGNVIVGSAEDDYISGELGADKINGGDGNDTLVGGAGNDSLNGGKGDDSLWGGAGTDTLFGDDGSDTFIYQAGDDKVIISDFDDTLDKIRVLSGDVGNPFTNKAGDVTFEVGDGQIVVKGGADKFIPIYDKGKNILVQYKPK